MLIMWVDSQWYPLTLPTRKQVNRKYDILWNTQLQQYHIDYIIHDKQYICTSTYLWSFCIYLYMHSAYPAMRSYQKWEVHHRQAGTLLPPGEGSNLSWQVGRQAGILLPPGEGNNSSQAGSQAGTLLSGEGSSSSQTTAHLPLGEGSSISQAIAHLPPGEGSNSPLATAHPPTMEGSSSSQAIAHLPPVEGSNSLPATAHLPPGKEAVPPRLLLNFPLGKVTVLPSQPLILPQGREVVILRQVKQAIKLGQAGRALCILPGIGHPRLPRRIVLPPRQTVLTPRKATPPLPSPIGFPKGLLMKNLTLSWSLTYPANLWPQLKGLFLLKDPILWFPPGNLLT